ncbi:centromere protein I-like [Amphiura filiformis]|uniref:centromere protein I-like n=1 Tax=Amphiura filiformis TaxID=82378 RepID=UPI003B21BC36
MVRTKVARRRSESNEVSAQLNITSGGNTTTSSSSRKNSGKAQYEVNDAVKYFTNVSSSTKVRGNLPLSLALTRLEEASQSSGLSAQHIQQLVQVASSSRFSGSVNSRLVKCLIPESVIPEDAVVSAISWMCTNKPSSALQTLLLKWIILTYDLIESRTRLHALYGIIFQFIENDMMCPLVCHLLYLLTRKEDVVGFRVRRLLDLQRRVGIQSHITALLSVYKLYKPHLVSLAVPSTQRVYFRQIDRKWAALVQAAKDRIAAAGRQAESVTDRLHETLTEKGPVSKRKRMELVPRVTTSSIMRDAEGAHYRLPGADRTDRVQLQDISSFENLLENLERLELPSQVAAVLRSPYLQHVISCQRQRHMLQRLSLWLFQVLSAEITAEDENQRGVELLQLLINFTDFLQVNIPVCETWLADYLLTWNGLDYRPYILRIFTRCRIYQFQKLNDLILEPLRTLFFCSSVFFKCQLAYCFTELLRNYVILELPRYRGYVAMKKVRQAASVQAADHDVDDAWDPLYEYHEEHFEALQTIQSLIYYVDKVFAVGLQQERDNSLLMHLVLSFYEMVSHIHTKYNVPFTCLPCPGVVYRAVFSSNAMACSRMCSIIARYRNEYSSLKQSSEASNNMSDLSKQVTALNGYILDISNSLWRHKAFTTSKTPSVFNMPTEIVNSTQVNLPNGSFSVHNHIALVGYARRFLVETQPEGKRVHPSLIRGNNRDTYLEFLKTERVDGVVDFISTFIKRSSNN